MSEEKKKETKMDDEVKKEIEVDSIEKDETKKEESESDNIQISDDVIASIAGMAAQEVPGVYEMAGGFAGGISEVLSGKKNMAKGIKVDVKDKVVKIDVNIIVEYGSRIPDVAFEIQKRVKTAVENMTGLKTSEVNVHVQGVQTKSQEEEKAEEDNAEEKKPAEEKAKKE